jgi:protein-S-isoprenylcysteine O-methyltransferase Ste14
MAIYNLLILASWLTLIAYWVLLARSAKRSVTGKWHWPREIGLRLAILILVLFVLHVLRAHHIRPWRYVVNTNRIAGYFGAATCLCGVILAVSARVSLGRNWGMPMTEKAHPELVTGGPYAYTRHPIYAGFILAILGSAIGQTVLWAIPLFIVGPYFVYSARREERLMAEQFPLQYPGYRKRTKMLIPFIL